MKVEEVLDQLKYGDEIWVKAKVSGKDYSDEPLEISFTGFSGLDWLLKDAEISLTEPQAEKVEVPDWFDQWYKKLVVDCSYHESKALVLINQCGDGHVLENFDGVIFGGTAKNSVIYTGWINSNRELASRAILDGYTVEQPKRFKVRVNGRTLTHLQFYKDGTPSAFCENGTQMVFTDKSKAAAVAVLVEGTVEEVAE